MSSLPKSAFAGKARSDPIELAIIVPTLNEAGNVASLVKALDAALHDLRREIIFVDDGSDDGTAERVADIARIRGDVRLIRRHGRRGLSSAVIEGAMATVADHVAVIDADMQHDEARLPEMLSAVRDGNVDIAIGTRYANGGGTGEWSNGRKTLSRRGIRLARPFIGETLSDPMSGFFLMRQDRLLRLVPRLSGVGFKILLDIVLSAPDRLRIAEIPYEFRTRKAGQSKLDSAVAIEFILLLIDKKLGRFCPPRLVLFGAIGSLGLVLHLAVLRLALDTGATFITAQTLAVIAAIAFNFTLNNRITYRDRRLRWPWAWLRGLASFYLICGLGAVANVGVGVMLFRADRYWWVAGAAGAAVGAVWNFALSNFFTWRLRQ